MNLKIAICDDNATDAVFVEEKVNDWGKSRGIAVRFQIFASAENFLFCYADDKTWDILLLDIEMGEMDGVTMARTIRKENETVQIVFISGYSDYIAEGYEVEALHYLIKPVNQDKLFTVLDRALEKIRQNERCLNLEIGGEMVRIPFYEIRYLEVRLNYVTIHAKEEYTVRHTLAEFEQELDRRFTRVGRSVILNLKCVRKVTKTQVHLFDGTVLPLPRGAYEPLNRAIIQYT